MTDESVRFISPMVRFISQIWELTWFWQKWKLRSDWLSNECLILFGVWFWIIHQNFLMASSKYIKSSTCNEFWLLYYKSMILQQSISTLLILSKQSWKQAEILLSGHECDVWNEENWKQNLFEWKKFFLAPHSLSLNKLILLLV